LCRADGIAKDKQMKSMNMLFLPLIVVAMVGCAASPYNAVRTGNDRFAVSGPDPNQVRGLAFETCRKEGFDDYSVVDSSKTGMEVRCEKTPASFFSQTSESANKAWEYVKAKVDDYRKEPTTSQ
jgi:hypothetical protein